MEKISAQVIQFLKDRKWDRPLPGNLAKSISIEAAELLELFQWINPTLSEVKKDKEFLEEIKKELADVLIYSYQMAGLLDLEVEKIINEKLKLQNKKYPAELMRKRYADKNYYSIRDQYRAKKLN